MVHVEYEAMHAFRLPQTRRSSVPMQMLLMPLKTGLRQKLARTLSMIQGIFRDKIAADLGNGSAGWEGVVLPRQVHVDFIYI
ncbi:uncharacterized protein MONOS_5150 [Monocercomonoides exilis]|uniref:uncharacterized protein n=1 Tax=Monocercomonoides exilis TaxID=2049356 RepID=UPI003559B494|nr:hypothetical protein MONOS_5150 [Monocercomonoides exilis]|eukprot:MONOS_5150.1-p1 / transcript=MONOS_5150.1 / gene=MONOS_5150 / organism=Monocercomonoides_exilis_PA203 / gene_product=unspecified product / transcript_product=unspecified product / location=Mono_scaffold00147:7033-7278(-) / protein_length=82 / sequence_SO=supercontig / SO=protein_coding / is_pseudo=false